MLESDAQYVAESLSLRERLSVAEAQVFAERAAKLVTTLSQAVGALGDMRRWDDGHP
jgi:hypothetical protein